MLFFFRYRVTSSRGERLTDKHYIYYFPNAVMQKRCQNFWKRSLVLSLDNQAACKNNLIIDHFGFMQPYKPANRLVILVGILQGRTITTFLHPQQKEGMIDLLRIGIEVYHPMDAELISERAEVSPQNVSCMGI